MFLQAKDVLFYQFIICATVAFYKKAAYFNFDFQFAYFQFTFS